jgi:hypothetical protein
VKELLLQAINVDYMGLTMPDRHAAATEKVTLYESVLVDEIAAEVS